MLLIAVAHKFMQLKKHNKRIKHRWWVHDIINNRLQQGAYHNLVKELQFEKEKFLHYLRTVCSCVTLYTGRSGEALQEQGGPRQRLAICLRYVKTP